MRGSGSDRKHAAAPEQIYVGYSVTESTAWRGAVCLADAYGTSAGHYVRVEAQRQLHLRCREELLKLGVPAAEIDSLRVQHSCYHTNYPFPLKGDVAIGNTVLAEIRKRRVLLREQYADYLENPFCRGSRYLDPEMMRLIAKAVVHALDEYDDFFVARECSAAEVYRMFLCAITPPHMHTYTDVVVVAVNRSDYVPLSVYRKRTPPTVIELLVDLQRISRRFKPRLLHAAEADQAALYVAWRNALMVKLVGHLRAVFADQAVVARSENRVFAPSCDEAPDCAATPEQQRQLLEADEWGFSALDAKRSPTLLDDRATLQERLESAGSDTANADVKRFLDDLNKACGVSGVEAPRSDHIESQLRASSDHVGPLQGAESTDHEVIFTTSKGEIRRGYLRDRAVEHASDLSILATFSKAIEPVFRALQQFDITLQSSLPRIYKRMTRGRLDRRRLGLLSIKDSVFQSTELIRQHTRGTPQCFLLALDGSGSMQKTELMFLGLLTGGLMMTAQRHAITVLAALYHGTADHAHQVQWIAHPHKSLARSRSEALASVAHTMWADKAGSGSQADALALAHLISEANLIGTQAQHITLFHITDCGFVKSWGDSGSSAAEEVQEVLTSFSSEMGERLHAVLLSLNPDSTAMPVLKDAYDEVIAFNKARFNPEDAASRIAEHIASRLF